MTSITDPWADSPSTPLEHGAPSEPRRSDLIAAAIDKPVRLFRQWDAWVPAEQYVGDYVTHPLDDGSPAVTECREWELRRGTPVRVQVKAGVSRQAALDGLHAIIRAIEADEATTCTACEQAGHLTECGSADCICDWTDHA